MFQFAGFASTTYEFSGGSSIRTGFPHSEICGSKPARGSPQLIAACYVLHRLSEPRHPRNALLALDLSMRRDKPGAYALLPTITLHGRIHGDESLVRKNLFTMTNSREPRDARRPRRSGIETRSRAGNSSTILPSNDDGSHRIVVTQSLLRSRPSPRGLRHVDLKSIHRRDVATQSVAEQNGGADRDRTDDLKLAKLALSQLSYGPIGATRALRIGSMSSAPQSRMPDSGGPGKI